MVNYQKSRKNLRGNHMKTSLVMLVLSSVVILVAASTISYGLLRQLDDDMRVSDALGFSGFSATLTEADGDIHVVWHDDRTGTYELFYNKIAPPDEFTIWPDDLQLTDSLGDSMYPTMALDTCGNIHVAWQDDRDGNWEIYYKKLDNDGNALTEDERVTNDPASSIRPSLSVDDMNAVHLTWYDNRLGNYDLYYNKRVEPDVTPQNIVITPEEFFEGEEGNLNVTVFNQGYNTATDIEVAFIDNNSTIDTTTITLAAQSNETISFLWTPLFGFHEIIIKVDPEDLIAESNEENNVIIDGIHVYRISEYSNMSIWANATIQHSEVLTQVTIEAENDPNASGTENSIDTYVNYTADPYFETATIRIGYDEIELGIIAEASLKMYYWDIYDYRGDRWAPIHDCGVNVVDDYVWANVSQFSIFTAIGKVTGDLDGDGDVDLADLAQLLANYGDTGVTYEDGDIDGDNDVDLADLAALLAKYGYGT